MGLIDSTIFRSNESKRFRSVSPMLQLSCECCNTPAIFHAKFIVLNDVDTKQPMQHLHHGLEREVLALHHILLPHCTNACRQSLSGSSALRPLPVYLKHGHRYLKSTHSRARRGGWARGAGGAVRKQLHQMLRQLVGNGKQEKRWEVGKTTTKRRFSISMSTST